MSWLLKLILKSKLLSQNIELKFSASNQSRDGKKDNIASKVGQGFQTNKSRVVQMVERIEDKRQITIKKKIIKGLEMKA